MRKAMAMLLCGALSLGLLTGCGGNGEEADSKDGTQGAENFLQMQSIKKLRALRFFRPYFSCRALFADLWVPFQGSLRRPR